MGFINSLSLSLPSSWASSRTAKRADALVASVAAHWPLYIPRHTGRYRYLPIPWGNLGFSLIAFHSPSPVRAHLKGQAPLSPVLQPFSRSLSLVRGRVRAQVKGQAPLSPALQHIGHSGALYIVVLISAHISVYIGMNLSVYIGIHRYNISTLLCSYLRNKTKRERTETLLKKKHF